ncbi:MAG TPA: GNAT family N-acetyltransferase [Ramlibacter sp.]|nr:GNAT family N-acetyltransferase [Ramlibacter sp.]
MELRRLTPADAVAYRELRLRALHEHPEAFTSSWDEDRHLALAASEQRLASQAFWGAWEGGVLVGMVGLERRLRAKERHKGTVVGMYVPPGYAGRGVGMALLQALLAQARAEGLRHLVLTVSEGNDAAQRLYERAGFRAFGIEPRAVLVGGRFLGKVHLQLALD